MTRYDITVVEEREKGEVVLACAPIPEGVSVGEAVQLASDLMLSGDKRKIEVTINA